jgi:hypothetical protein
MASLPVIILAGIRRSKLIVVIPALVAGIHLIR